MAKQVKNGMKPKVKEILVLALLVIVLILILSSFF